MQRSQSWKGGGPSEEDVCPRSVANPAVVEAVLATLAAMLTETCFHTSAHADVPAGAGRMPGLDERQIEAKYIPH